MKILSELVKKLLALVPSPSLPYVVISYPSLIALYSEDISDTAEYLSLRGLEEYYPREIIAAYAGHGMGLCRNIQNEEQSKSEGSQLPAHGTLLIEYTEQALLLQIGILREAIDLGDNDIHAAASFELGSNSQMDKHAYHVAEFVNQFLREWDFLIPGEILVIITGNIDDTIQEAIREVVKGLVAKVELITSQSEYVAARGAAELAWRANILD